VVNYINVIRGGAALIVLGLGALGLGSAELIYESAAEGTTHSDVVAAAGTVAMGLEYETVAGLILYSVVSDIRKIASHG